MAQDDQRERDDERADEPMLLDPERERRVDDPQTEPTERDEPSEPMKEGSSW